MSDETASGAPVEQPAAAAQAGDISPKIPSDPHPASQEAEAAELESNGGENPTNEAHTAPVTDGAEIGEDMAFPTAVNDQITDSVTQSNVKVLGEAPSVALANLYQATAQALANAAHNATTAQQQASILAQAATVAGVSLLYSGNQPRPAVTEAGPEYSEPESAENE